MQIVLLQVVNNLGVPGDVVNVRPGSARNFLVPLGKAIVATTKNVKQFEAQKRIAEARRLGYVQQMRTLGDKISKSRLQFSMKAGPSGKLFGSVTSRMIAEALSLELGEEVQKTQVALDKPIREAGDFILEVRLHEEVNGRVKIHVAAEISDAEPESDETSGDRDDENAASDVAAAKV